MNHAAAVSAVVVVCIGLFAFTRLRFTRARRARRIDAGQVSQQWRSERVRDLSD
jgi:hypothetical protein